MAQGFAYRGFMLDVARHYMPVDNILRVIEAASLCGMNRMHWHLVDDQGWRLEIKRYPRLTEVGSRRGKSFFGAEHEELNNEGFYTQDEIRKIAAFAAEKGIQIVPEIEIPGHAAAMLAAYPEYGCRREISGPDGIRVDDAPYKGGVVTIAGVFPELICAGREDSVRFLEDILQEVTELFPGPEVHIGGDEAIKLHWRRCPDCQRRMKAMGLKNERELQRDLVLRMGDFLAKRGKKTIVWNESLEGGLLPDHFIVQHWWGNDQETEAFMAAGGKVISSETAWAYISRPYGDIDVRTIYDHDAIPAYAKAHPENLLGMECPLWGERVTTPERANYMLFPRLAATAIIAGDPANKPDWPSFVERLKALEKKWEALGISGAPHDLWALSPEDGQAERAWRTKYDGTPEMKRTWRICDGLILQEKLERLLRDIAMPRPFALRIMDKALSDIPEYALPCPDMPDDGLTELIRQLRRALDNREKGPWKDIPEDIWIDTMACYTRFVGEYFDATGAYAFDRAFWTVRQMDAKLFRIGQLEYELLDDNGQKAIHLHIPSDIHLESGLLNESVSKARAFLKAYRPDWADAPMTLHTWLLSPKLKDLLPPASRILALQRAFDLTEINESDMGGVKWVWNLTGEWQKDFDPTPLPEKTTLQRGVKALLLKGEAPGSAKGILVRAF